MYLASIAKGSVSIPENSKILIFYPTLNIGRTLKQMVSKIKHISNNSEIVCLTFFSRLNAINETRGYTKECFEELRNDGVHTFCFYASSLPFYLTDVNNAYHSHIEAQLKYIC